MSEAPMAASAGDLRKMKFLYFVFFAGNGVFFTFINVYYVGLGLSGMQIGIINTLSPLAGIIGMTLWGLLNDPVTARHGCFWSPPLPALLRPRSCLGRRTALRPSCRWP